MTAEPSLKEIQKGWHTSLKSYGIGFTISILLTVISFLLVITKILSGNVLTYTLIGLAVLQAIIQLIFFLHIGQEAKPRWETMTFGFTVLVLLIIVIGSLWIMHDLENRMMPEMAQEMAHD